MNAVDKTLADLSPRQRECYEMLAKGVPPKQIADTLALDIGTVSNHLRYVGMKARSNGAVWAKVLVKKP